jgi:hypothetical protein
MDLELTGKRALVTGGSRGTGLAVAVSGLAARSAGAITGTIRNVAVSALSKNLADELGKDGINVTHPVRQLVPAAVIGHRPE